MSDALLVGLAVLIALHVATLGLLWLRRPPAPSFELRRDLATVKERAEQINAGIAQALYRVDELRRPLASLGQPQIDLSPVREAVAEQAAALQRVVDEALHATLPQPKPAKPHAPQFVLRSHETTGRVARSIYVCEAEDCGHIYYADTPLEGGA